MLPTAPPVEGRHWPSTPPVLWPDLRGRVVLVVFWSLACEASLLTLRRLSDIVEQWDDDVAVLAVHTPRFPFEDDVDVVEAAILRHRVVFPVLHDPEYLTWNRYNPEGWPAVAVVDRRGRVIGMQAGSGRLDVVAEVVENELAHPAGRRDADDGGAVEPLPTPKVRAVESTLAFPSGVALTPSGRLVIADTGNDRLLIGPLDHDLRTFRPQFEITDIDRPTSVLCADDEVMYVVESGQGSVLRLDVAEGSMEELVGELASPQGLTFDVDGSIVVADAGTDRLLRIMPEGLPGGHRSAGFDQIADTESAGRECVVSGVIAGSGFIGCRDGAAADAELAQPVSVARTDAGVVFADAASSNIRLLTDDGRVRTVTGNGFYDWGLVDGPAHRARLQRPGGLCVLPDGSIVIADTGNDRRRILADRHIRTVGLAGLRRPTALAVLPGGHLVVADTGNHRLVVADLALQTAWPLAVYPAELTSTWETALPQDGSHRFE